MAISFSRGSSQPRDSTPISCIAGGFFTTNATWKPTIYLNLNNSCLSALFIPLTFFWKVWKIKGNYFIKNLSWYEFNVSLWLHWSHAFPAGYQHFNPCSFSFFFPVCAHPFIFSISESLWVRCTSFIYFLKNIYWSIVDL